MSKKEPSVKILVGYHKPAYLLKSDVLVPIHLGRALATEASKDGVMSKEDYQWMLDNMIGDDTGDNISKENRKFCELTALYWAWKNYDKLGNPDYIGFMHYRRHFKFNSDYINFVEKNYWYTSYIDQNYISDAGLNNNCIYQAIKNTDVIYPCPVKHDKDVKSSFYQLATALDLNIKYFCKFTETVKSLFPNLKCSLDDYLNSNGEIPCNMFIMKRELFFKYAEMLFTVLFQTDKTIDYSGLSINGKRILAYASEKLLAAYILNLKSNKNFKFKTLPISKTKDTDISLIREFKPAFNKNSIPVVYVTDNNYTPYTAVSIKSCIDNFSSNNNLDVIILDDNISEENKKRLSSLSSSNVSIRFYNMSSLTCNEKFYVHGHFSKAAYYRAWLPDILKNYDKVFYFDGDTIICTDISELYYEINFNNKELLAAALAINPCHAALRGNLLKSKNMSMLEYWNNILKIKSPLYYFNTGIMLLNLKEMRNVNFLDKFKKKLLEIEEPPGVDQDIFNSVVNNIVILSQKWNFMGYGDVKNFDKWLPEDIANDFFQAQKKPYIIHFASKIKPWDNLSVSNSFLFWRYARETPFYEILQEKLYSNSVNKKTKISFIDWLRNYAKYMYYRIVNNVVLSKYRNKYHQKKIKYKKKLKGY